MSRATLDFACCFARVLQDCPEITISDLRSMCRLRGEIGRLENLSTGGLTERQDASLERSSHVLFDLAAKYKFTVDFSNPYPSIYKGKQHVDVPCA